MKKLKFIIVLLFVGIIGCAPELTRREKASIGVLGHPEWSEYHKQLIKEGTIETGMTPEQVELAREWNLTFEWRSSGGTSYYSAGNWGKCPRGYSGRSCYFRWRLCFYDDKLESWSNRVSTPY